MSSDESPRSGDGDEELHPAIGTMVVARRPNKRELDRHFEEPDDFAILNLQSWLRPSTDSIAADPTERLGTTDTTPALQPKPASSEHGRAFVLGALTPHPSRSCPLSPVGSGGPTEILTP
jgi:hypothetical protein